MNFEQSIEIAAPAEVLFSLTQDYGRRLAWDPFLKSAELVGGATAAAVGVKAYCVAKNGYGMETEYVSFNPPRACAVKMTRGPWFLSAFAGSWRFEELGPHRTRVEFRYHLKAWPAWADRWLSPWLGRLFARDVGERLAALKRAGEAG